MAVECMRSPVGLLSRRGTVQRGGGDEERGISEVQNLSAYAASQT
jgi:hypothetical protein